MCYVKEQLSENMTLSTKPETTYHNAARGGPIHGHGQRAHEISEFWLRGLQVTI